MRSPLTRSTLRATIIAIPVLLALHYFITHLLAFIHIFYQHPGIAITQRELADAYLNGTLQVTQKGGQIPKIIHQIFHNWKDPQNETLPGDWEEQRRSCVEGNPGWEYKLWTPTTSLSFLSTYYPTFLPSYLSYPHPVQRVDALRYFLLYHYGGIYLDLDNGCLPPISPSNTTTTNSPSSKTPINSLDPLTYFPLWVTDGGRGALSNNILAARAGHPFWGRVVAELISGRGALPTGTWTERVAAFWKRWWCLWGVLRYVEISWGVGQWFLGGVWDEYHRMLELGRQMVGGVTRVEGGDLVDGEEVSGRLYRLMMDDRPGYDEWVFFTQGRGGTWNGWDNRLFLEIGDHLVIFFMVLGLLVGGAGWVVKRYWGQRGKKRYRKVKGEDLEDRN
ncbi:nucleotide-diphospho-sugar transferase [Sordaria brevicollis]|uniref:Nucleotide-diphospho-sugar transferase n=1 Tax=Sordaria brevicollis TaxID=83679 RepID=A0AAE0UFS3_SORBR|nr:nucleotide-diphospho-sugar transferase [Sordaria brevicollis]